MKERRIRAFMQLVKSAKEGEDEVVQRHDQ
jgi:hypothetical protein